MASEKILIVDDAKEICALIQTFLRKMNYTSDVAFDAASAIGKVKSFKPDLIVLDIILPDMNGVDLCLEIRKLTDCPVLFLSCKSDTVDKVAAFSAGGDDYVTKPFLPEELMVRIRAHLRRARITRNKTAEKTVFEHKGLTVDMNSYEVFLEGEEIKLTAKEFDILALLIQNPKRVFSVEQLFEQVWKSESLGSDSKTVMVYMSNLRKKLEKDQGGQKYITNIRGFGYKING